MSVIIMKFGGTSVADVQRFKSVASKVKKKVEEGFKPVVVVSAMALVTDSLVERVKQVSSLDNPEKFAEYDSILSTGEQISSSLLALILIEEGLKARSWLGWQLKFNCDSIHGKSRILNIDVSKILASLARGEVAIVAGFQGVNQFDRITTLGRGGSDTTAVALAAVMGAEICEIYTDVEGVYSADPRIVSNAKKIEKITYEEMLEMSSLGAKVMQTRSVEMAKKYNVDIMVHLVLKDTAGTLISKDGMERLLVTGITSSKNEASIGLKNIIQKSKLGEFLFKPLADNLIDLDMIVRTTNDFKKISDLTFTVASGDLEKATKIIESNSKLIAYESLEIKTNIAKVSIVGVGIKSHAQAACIMFEILEENSVEIFAMSTSEIKISILIDNDEVDRVVNLLHNAFNLEGDL